MSETTSALARRGRRAHGTGSITEIIKNKKYLITYDRPHFAGSNPRRQRRETFVGSKSGAEKLLSDRLAEIRNGAYPDEDRLTFNELADRYLVAKALSKEPTTIAWYKRHLEQHVRPILGGLELRAIRAHHVQAMIAGACNKSRTRRRGEPLNPTSLRNLLVATRAVLAWGVKQGYVVRNVADNVEQPAIPFVERSVLGLESFKQLLDASAGSELAAIIATAVGTGLRRSELCALQWGDIDLDAGTILVQRAAANLDGKVILKAPKTRRSKRVDQLPPFVVAVLQRHRSSQAQRHLVLGLGNRGPQGMVFDRLDGRAWDPNELSRKFSRFIRRAALPPFRFHDLRHGYATLAFAAGIPLKTVSESMGHSAIGVTDAIYVHLGGDAKRDKAKRLDAYLDSAVSSLRERPEAEACDTLVTSEGLDEQQKLTA